MKKPPLRRCFVAPRRKLQQAYELNLTNPTIIDNLDLLNGSYRSYCVNARPALTICSTLFLRDVYTS